MFEHDVLVINLGSWLMEQSVFYLVRTMPEKALSNMRGSGQASAFFLCCSVHDWCPLAIVESVRACVLPRGSHLSRHINERPLLPFQFPHLQAQEIDVSDF